MIRRVQSRLRCLEMEKVCICHEQWAWLSVHGSTEVQTVNFLWATGGGIETLLGVLRSRFEACFEQLCSEPISGDPSLG